MRKINIIIFISLTSFLFFVSCEKEEEAKKNRDVQKPPVAKILPKKEEKKLKPKPLPKIKPKPEIKKPETKEERVARIKRMLKFIDVGYERRRELVKIGKEVIPYAIEFYMATKSFAKREALLDVFGDLKDSRCGEFLLKILKGKKLEELAEKKGEDRHSSERQYYTKAIKTLGKIGFKKASAYLLSIASNANLTKEKELIALRFASIEALGDLKDASCVPLLTKLLDEDAIKKDYRRLLAIRALGKIGEKSAIPKIVKLLESDDECWSGHKVSIIHSLGKLKAESETSKLGKFLTFVDKDVRNASMQALCEIGGESAKKEFFSIIEKTKDINVYDETSPNINHRFFVLKALAKLREKKAVHHLIGLLEKIDPFEDIELEFKKQDVRDVLKELTGKDFGMDYNKWKEWHEKTQK